MENNRKKQLAEEYRHRKPEMGVISFYCIPAGETFLGASKDTKADFNSNRFKLNAGLHPNKRLLALWKQYEENDFELSVPEALKYEDPGADHSDALEKMLIKHLEATPAAQRIWK